MTRLDPVSSSIVLMSLGLRLFTRSKVKRAVSERNEWAKAYERSFESTRQEREAYLGECNSLAGDKQAALGAHYNRLVRLLTNWLPDALESNGVFGKLSLPEVKTLVDNSHRILILNPKVFGAATTITTGVALMLQTLEWTDRAGFVSLPFINTSIHDALAALPLEGAGEVADALGKLGVFSVADVAADGLILFGAFTALRNLTRAKKLQTEAAELKAAIQQLDARRAVIVSMREQVRCLFDELNASSYQLFKWTVVAEEAARCHSPVDSTRPARPTLPQWIVRGLRSCSLRLWATLQKPAFT